MALVNIMPILAGLGFVAFALVMAGSNAKPRENAWVFPAVLCAAFLAWSVFAVLAEGPFGFWPEHSRNLWGNQIWFDLLLAAGIALTLLVPAARNLGMRPLPWVIAVICTGSIGLLAMMARVLFLRARTGSAQT